MRVFRMAKTSLPVEEDSHPRGRSTANTAGNFTYVEAG